MNINWSNSGIEGRPASAPPSRPAQQGSDSRAARYEAAINSPEQQRTSGEIYAKLKAGASADDLRPLIGRLRETVIDQARRSDASQRARRRG